MPRLAKLAAIAAAVTGLSACAVVPAPGYIGPSVSYGPPAVYGPPPAYGPPAVVVRPPPVVVAPAPYYGYRRPWGNSWRPYGPRPYYGYRGW